MKISKGILNQDRIILLLLIFVLSSASLWVRYLVFFPDIRIYSIFEKILFYFGFFFR